MFTKLPLYSSKNYLRFSKKKILKNNEVRSCSRETKQIYLDLSKRISQQINKGAWSIFTCVPLPFARVWSGQPSCEGASKFSKVNGAYRTLYQFFCKIRTCCNSLIRVEIYLHLVRKLLNLVMARYVQIFLIK